MSLPTHGVLAQLGALKKKLDKATGKDPAAQSVGEPVKFDDVVLEITQERIEKLIAAKRAAKQMLESPDGPAAIEKQLLLLDEREAAIYGKQVDAINAWDEKRRDHENCLDSAFSAIRDRARGQGRGNAMSDPSFIRKTMELAAAQQKGDTAAVRKLTEQMDTMKAPPRADSLEAAKQCGDPAPPAIVKEWLSFWIRSASWPTISAASRDTASCCSGGTSSPTTRPMRYSASSRRRRASRARSSGERP